MRYVRVPRKHLLPTQCRTAVASDEESNSASICDGDILAKMGSLPVTIGPYRILRQLGSGGMGTVFEGIHETIERRVAIKVLRPEYAYSPDAATRFVNEARAVNRVEHPGVVQVSDHGRSADGTAYIVMEYLKGETLASRIDCSGGRIPVGDALQLAWQLADSLAAAHAMGIIHRDVKPQNIMLVADPHMPTGERTKILDFGLAKLTTANASPFSKTSSNALVGTPLYMSPEQCAGAGKVDAKSDVYALGCILYEMFGGRPPFLAEGFGELLSMHMHDEPQPLRKLAPSLNASVAALVHRLLQKDRARRPSMKQLVRELEDLFPLVPAPERRIPAEPAEQGPANSQEMRRIELASTLGHAASQTKLPRRPGWRLWGAVGGAVIIVSFVGGVGARRWTGAQKQADSQVHQPLPAPAPPPPAVAAAVEASPPPAPLSATPQMPQPVPDMSSDNPQHEVVIEDTPSASRKSKTRRTRHENKPASRPVESRPESPVSRESYSPPAHAAPPLED